jgi:hypothetical protein
MTGAPLGPLHGLPIAIKDLYDFKASVRNTFGAKPLATYVPDRELCSPPPWRAWLGLSEPEGRRAYLARHTSLCASG